MLIFRCISVAQFSALPHMVIASPLPHPTTPLLIGQADLVFKLASTGRPCGRLTSLPAPGPAATRLGSRRSRHRLPSPTSPGHDLDLLLRARLHSRTSPRIMSPRIMSPRIISPVGDTHGQGSAVTSGFSGLVSMLAPGCHVPTLPHVPRSRSLIPLSRPPGHVPIPTASPSLRLT